MKNHSSARAQKGQTAYRTPSMFRANADFTSVKSSIRDFARKQNRDKAPPKSNGFFKNKSF